MTPAPLRGWQLPWRWGRPLIPAPLLAVAPLLAGAGLACLVMQWALRCCA